MDKNPLISIITVSYNSGEFIEDTINSVLNQTYDNIEHVVIDGKSNDKTVEIIKSYEKKYKKTKKNLKWVSEKDEGIYDGMNKGLKKANGNIIGFLNSEDFYANNNVIKNVISSFGDNKDIIFGNLDFIKGKNKDRVLRKYRAENFNRKKLKFGIAPPHNSIFMKSKLYEKYGSFKTDYTVSGDFEIF